MSRVLLLGHNPPQFEGHSKIEAAHYRTWQFLQPLLDDGHEICLCVDSSNAVNTRPHLPEDWAKQLVYHPIPFRHRVGWVRRLQRIHDAFDPDCIVAVDFALCLCATRLRTSKPIWMDIYGDYLTIMQASRYRAGSDRGIPTSIAFVRQVLRKGDVFSVCGMPQKHALTGELGMAGRLNWRTFRYQFAHVVLPGALPVDSQTVERGERSLLSSIGVPEDGFVVLWCGGYNTWTDVEALFAGLEWAMAREPKVHYVSVGANTYEAPDNVYTRLLRMIKQSRYRDRFHMLGWRPWAEAVAYYGECDVGLNIDALHYETIYGTRTRLVEMIAAGLPVITSLGCELSDLLSENGAALAFRTGDWRGLGKQVLALATDRDRCIDMAQTALSYAANELSFSTTTAPVRAWVREPQLAPDRVSGFQEQVRQVEYRARSAVRQVIWRVVGLDKHRNSS
jgi:glycosyltransferase involved in cell wall biosynthesis